MLKILMILLLNSLPTQKVTANKKPRPHLINQVRSSDGKKESLTIVNPLHKEITVGLICGAYLFDDEEPVVKVPADTQLNVEVTTDDPPISCSIGHWAVKE